MYDQKVAVNTRVAKGKIMMTPQVQIVEAVETKTL